jgi:hypothetical protein
MRGASAKFACDGGHFFRYTLKEQAAAFHTADVIISPHGAQHTNGAFVRPCTAVLELYPRNYYYPKKGPLVMEAGGLAYDGYHFNGSPRAETPSVVSQANVTLFENLRALFRGGNWRKTDARWRPKMRHRLNLCVIGRFTLLQGSAEFYLGDLPHPLDEH